MTFETTMSPTVVHCSRSALSLLSSTRPSRCISSVSHFVPAELHLYFKHMEAKARLSPLPIPQKPPEPRFLRLQIYHPESSTWAAIEKSVQKGLRRGSVLKVVSWNIDWSSPGPAARASAALEHLKELFGEVPGDFVVMLQEVCHKSLQVILENPWVQRNFVLSNVDPPKSLYTNSPGQSFILKHLKWRAVPYFTLMMISRHLAITDCFRVPFVTVMGRDALVVDIPVFNHEGRTQPKESLRLCTTHLESLWGGRAYRPGQLAMVSALLKGEPTIESKIIAGLVGGDMNAIDRSEHEFPKASDVDLKDVWEDIPAAPIPILKPFQKDFSYGRARGNTWGYQSNSNRNRKRMDKFFYTGSIETVALDEAQDVTGRLGRLGINLKTEVEAWENETTKMSLLRGKYVEELHKQYYSEDQAARWRDRGISSAKELVCTKISTWVSDHFGIVVGIKVL